MSTKLPCEICRRPTSGRGFARYQHMMKHVREGKAERSSTTYGLLVGEPSLDRWIFTPVHGAASKPAPDSSE